MAVQSRGGRRGTAARLCVVPFVVVAREKKRADPKDPTPPRGRKVLQITVHVFVRQNTTPEK